MFTNSANFNSMLDTNEQIKVSDVVHKAFIEINEDGVRAAAATGELPSHKPGPTSRQKILSRFLHE